MFGIFTRSRSPKAARSPMKYARLSLESLESRFCPSAPTLSNLTSAALANHQVRVSGTVSTIGTATITLSGAVNGQLTSGYGTFNYIANGNTGTVTLVAVDQSNLTSNPGTVTVNNPTNPSITNFTVTHGSQRTLTISGKVNSVDFVLNVVSFSGVVSTAATTDSNGNFSVTTTASGLGTVNASVSDSWGQTGINSAQVTSNNPIISNFRSVAGPNNGWTFTGTVIDESAPNLAVTFAGLPELQGQKVYVDAQGNFSFSVVINPNENGTVSVQTTDWWSLNSNTAYTFIN